MIVYDSLLSAWIAIWQGPINCIELGSIYAAILQTHNAFYVTFICYSIGSRIGLDKLFHRY